MDCEGSRPDPLAEHIVAGMVGARRRLVAAGYFPKSGPDPSAQGAGPVLGHVNYVDPCREDNGVRSSRI